MTDQSPSAPATLRQLLHRVWQAVLCNKGLVVVVVLTSLLQAFFTKAPLILIKPVGDALQRVVAGVGPNDATDPGQELDFTERLEIAFLDGVESFSAWSCGVLGLQFEGESGAASQTIVGCGLLAAIAGVIGAAFIYLSLVLSRFFATKVIVDLRNEVAQHLMRLPLRYYGRQRLGELISNLTNNTQVLSRSITLIADHVVTDPAMILMNVGIIALFEPRALWIILPAIPLMALPMVRLGRKVHKRSGSSLAAMGDATESMNQMLSGIKTIKTFRLEERQLEDFRQSNDRYLHRTKRMLQAKGRSQAIVFVGYQIAFAALLVLWAVAGTDLTLGDLAIVLVPISTTYTHIKRVSRAYNTMMESLGALDAVEHILDEDVDTAEAGRQLTTLESVEGRVAMRDVRFAYGPNEVLHGIDFEVEPGTSVALVGASGAGKSTILDLLVRLHEPSEGEVLIDGQALHDLDIDSYRQHVAVVVQQPFLFNTSIYENIACGRVGATPEQVESAARAAQIHDFIETLPQRYDTVVGERGSNLSGGQMQRIAIARAMVRDPAILFLDEATAALDSESEEAVQKAISNLMKGRTSFAIAHRLSTIRDSDLILVIEAGRVVERGTHDELVAADGFYRRLIDLQTGVTNSD